MKEEEILDKLRKMLFNTQKANECGLSNNDFKDDIEVLSGILDLYQKEKEKNKSIKNNLVNNFPESMTNIANETLHTDVSNFILSIEYHITNLQIKLYELEKEIKELKNK